MKFIMNLGLVSMNTAIKKDYRCNSMSKVLPMSVN